MTDTMALWKGSHWLSNTPKLFAQRAFKEEWEAAVAHRGSKLWIHNVMEAGERLKEQGMQPGLELLASGLQEADELARPKRELLERATEEVRKRLRTGQYRAFGFDRPRTLDTQPVQLPTEVWTSNKSLDETKVRFQSMVFTDVRVRMVREDNDPLLAAGLAHSQSKPGRPTIKDDVEFVFTTMENRGLVDVKRPANSHYDIVRRLLSEFFPDQYVDPDKPTNEGIRPHFTPLFKELKKSRKQ
ncbi:hypothetical protein [Shimia sp. R9_3]|uniref:hypothetical protein n=1 Tax=Shimia sp. R9_3 TaxID=2821113 RepID=UPI001ADB68DF|nr:hypothetical protein [Shimia sp. R9_3]MBO9403224.1 hypothetical protein [Shimia sp. R9_3]